ncbi:hypothetical protein V8C37DRAFT_392799 [Trichoderma ceciliae]
MSVNGDRSHSMTKTRCGFIATGNHHSKTSSHSPVRANTAASAVIATIPSTQAVVTTESNASKMPAPEVVLDKTSSSQTWTSGRCSSISRQHNRPPLCTP